MEQQARTLLKSSLENITVRVLATEPSAVNAEPPLSDEQVFNYIFTHSTAHFWGEEETDGVKIMIYLPNSASYAYREKTLGHTALIVKNADDGVFYDYSYGRYMPREIDPLRGLIGCLGTGVFVKEEYEDTLNAHISKEEENVYVYSLRYTDKTRSDIIDYIQKIINQYGKVARAASQKKPDWISADDWDIIRNWPNKYVWAYTFKEAYNYHEFNLFLRNCTTFAENILVNASPRWELSRGLTPLAELNYLRSMDIMGQVKKEIEHEPKRNLSAAEFASIAATLANA